MATLFRPLSHDQTLHFMWKLGAMLVDNNDEAAVVVLYGPQGGEGKGVMMKNISMWLKGSVVWCSTDLIGAKAQMPDSDYMNGLSSAKGLVCDEVAIADGFSYRNIKKLTSNSPIDDNPVSCIQGYTVFATSNEISFYQKVAVNDSIGRRLTIYRMENRIRSYHGMNFVTSEANQ